MAMVMKAQAMFSPQTRAYSIHLVGGGQILLELQASDLEEVAGLLATQRHLLGRCQSEEGLRSSSLARVPANRIQLVLDAND